MTGPRLLLLIALAIAAMCGAIVAATGDPQPVIRWTARTSLVLFSLAYVARPAQQLWRTKLTKRLLAERKWIGDGFAVSHLAHLAAILAVIAPDLDTFARNAGMVSKVGALTFVFIFAMAITSIDRVRAAMSKRTWKALHWIGMQLIWIVFASTYALRLARSPVWAVPLAVLVGIAAIRAAAWLRLRQRRTVGMST